MGSLQIIIICIGTLKFWGIEAIEPIFQCSKTSFDDEAI